MTSTQTLLFPSHSSPYSGGSTYRGSRSRTLGTPGRCSLRSPRGCKHSTWSWLYSFSGDSSCISWPQYPQFPCTKSAPDRGGIQRGTSSDSNFLSRVLSLPLPIRSGIIEYRPPPSQPQAPSPRVLSFRRWTPLAGAGCLKQVS